MTSFVSLGLESLKSVYQNKAHSIMLSVLFLVFCHVITPNANYLILCDRPLRQIDRHIIKGDGKM